MRQKKLIAAAAITIIMDQITKIVLTNKKYPVLGFDIISYTENTGAAFSILPGQRLLLIAVASAALIVLLYYATKIREKEKKLQIPTGMLIGGIAGNLIDRILLGYVRDFINLEIWPTFNIADTAMFIAIILLIIHLFKKK